MKRTTTVLILALAACVPALRAVELTEDQLRQLDLLEDYGQGYRIQDSGPWRMVTNATVDEAKALFGVLERAHATFGQVAEHCELALEPPSDRMLVILHRDRAAFDDYFQRSGRFAINERIGGFYSPLTNRIECYAGEEDAAGRVSHEVCHQLCYNQGLLARREDYPMWIIEGWATQFEMGDPTVPYGPLTANNPERRADLVKSYRKRWLEPLEELMAWAQRDVEDIDDVGRDGEEEAKSAPKPKPGERIHISRLYLIYTQGYGVCRFLIRERPREFGEYVRIIGSAAAPASAAARLEQVEAAFGPIADLQAAWEAWLATELANDPDPPEDEGEPPANPEPEA